MTARPLLPNTRSTYCSRRSDGRCQKIPPFLPPHSRLFDSPHGARGEYVFRSGPLAEVNIGSLPTYVNADGRTLYLYSSLYGPWIYRGALVLRLFYPTYVYVNSTCGVVPPMRLGGRQGAYPIDVVIPPSYEGNCVVNFTQPIWLVAGCSA